MKAPYYKLEKSKEAEVLSTIILSDKTPLHYHRRRARHNAGLWVMSDSFTREVFGRTEENGFDFDELYVVYDKKGLPLCVSVNDVCTRVLHADSLFQINANKLNVTRNPRALYFAYLDTYPRSALDMDEFVPQRKKYFLAPENCLYDSVWTAVTEGENKTYFSLNAAKSGVGIWKLHKILFELDKNCRITTVYSAVGKTYGKFITRADVVSRGEAVLTELEKIASSDSRLKEILQGLL